MDSTNSITLFSCAVTLLFCGVALAELCFVNLVDLEDFVAVNFSILVDFAVVRFSDLVDFAVVRFSDLVDFAVVRFLSLAASLRSLRKAGTGFGSFITGVDDWLFEDMVRCGGLVTN